MDNKEELLPVVDQEGRVSGTITRQKAHDGSKILHPVVHLHVFNNKGELFLQQRPLWKDIQPGRWDTACGGHVDFGETPESALLREVREELGITEFKPMFITKYVFDNKKEKELVYVNATIYNGEVRPNADELSGGRFWTSEEIKENMGKGIFTPNFENEYNELIYPWISRQKENDTIHKTLKVPLSDYPSMVTENMNKTT